MTIYLTARQQQVCEYLCLGWNSKEIAGAMGISHRTVEDHRLKVLQKHKVKNVVQLMRKVYRIGEVA